MQPKTNSMIYRPFKYPPDYSLARIHQKATMPGQIDANQLSCPCCNQPIKKPFNTWWNRSVQKDFKDYGGGMISYFWLAKLYCISIVLVIALYGIYLQYLNWTYCSQLDDSTLKGQVCNKLFGVWIITNQDLYDLMVRLGDRDVEIRFSILRSVVFVILIATNASSLYIMKWFKSRYPDKQNVANFSLLFKNLPTDDLEYLLTQLRSQFGNFNVSEAFVIKQAQPFYSKYKEKLQLYYQCRRQSQNPKKVKKLKQKLNKIESACELSEPQFQSNSRRAIIVFNLLDLRNRVLERYQINKFKKVCMFLGNSYQQPESFYCQQCPKPQQIIWKNIGIKQKAASKAKVLSIVYFIGVLVLSILILFLLSRILYFQSLVQPLRAIVQNIVLVIVVAIAIFFRKSMDILAQMRFPYTYTNRTMFIVITTVLLHFIFYLWLPSAYLNLYHDIRGSVLNLMSNQALTAVIVQVLLTYLDLFYCCWNSRKKVVQNQDNPFACQKILHDYIQYPRFPFQFKMIVLFKFWSLITFFAFHTPMVLALIFVALVFHYIKDKFNLYFHYRSQIIDNQVQFNFLKLYTNLFTIYMYIIFVHTQKHVIQYILGAIVTTIALFVQLFYFRHLKSNDPHEQQARVNLLSDIADISGQTTSFYKQRHDSFFESVKSEVIDNQIKNYLSENGAVSLLLRDEDWSVMTKSV